MGQQRSMRLRGGATNELLVGRVNVDDGVPGQEVANGGSCRGSPTQRHNGLVRERLGDGCGLHQTKCCFSVGGKNIGDRTALALHDKRIGVDVGDTETLG